MTNHSLKNYRDSKIILEHITAILKVINLSIEGLSIFQSYLPVIKILNVMREQKTLFECHQKKCEEVIKSKGKYNHEG